MSAASPASPQVRRPAAAAPSRSPSAQAAVRRPVAATAGFAFADMDDGDEIKINLGDIPRMKETLDIEGFKPTLLSRLFDLVAPLR
jgi:hypothetical protein